MCGFDGVQGGNYFGGETIRMRSQEMMKGGSNRVMDLIWRLSNMAFESGVVPEDTRSAVIVP